MDVTRFTLRIMEDACCNTSRALPYDAYIQLLVEHIYRKPFHKETMHKAYTPNHKDLQKKEEETLLERDFSHVMEETSMRKEEDSTIVKGEYTNKFPPSSSK